MPEFSKWVPEDLLTKYEVHNFNHALEILTQSFSEEWEEIEHTLRTIQITICDITTLGGNTSPIPPKFSDILEPLGWKEIRISGDLIIKFYPRSGKKKGQFAETPDGSKEIKDFIDGHNIDFVKNRVAIDVEWNSKDQTFDRDLFAMRTYYECGVISVGIIIARSENLNDVFKSLGKEIMDKYGASTTWMGKLLPRLDSRRHGGCPILAIGINNKCIVDWSGNAL